MTQFKFWLENKLDQEFTLELDQIKEKFINWMENKDNDWLDHYFLVSISAFIADDDGLNSVMNINDQRVLSDTLNETLHTYLDSVL